MLNLALEIAKANPVKGLPQMAAVIAKRRKVLSVGLNSRKSHPMMLRFSRSELKICQHAEVAAIIQALKNNTTSDLLGANIFVARVLKSGCPALAKPCKHCQRAIEAYGLRPSWTVDI